MHWLGRCLPRLDNEVGGGSKPQQPQFVQPPPPQITQGPAPNPGETSRQLFESQLQYNPQLSRQAADLQTQLAPQLAQSQFDIQKQFSPQYRQLYEQIAPYQTKGIDLLAEQAYQGLSNPRGLNPQQQQAQDFSRQRSADELSRNIRQQANLGGTLYGGHRQDQERRAQAELQSQFSLQDIGLDQQRRAQSLQELIAGLQVYQPQVQQPGVPGFGQSVTPSPDALMQSIQQSYLVNPSQFQQGTPGQPSWLGSFSQGYGA